MAEQWRDVSGYEGIYQVSDRGGVERIGGRVFKPSLQNGYPAVTLRHNGKSRSRYVHRLVAAAFIGPCPEGHIVHHKDEDRTNAHVVNLEYVPRGDHCHNHHILNYLRIKPGGPGHGITMFD